MKKALVLGAGGFIGSHLVTRLKKEGFWVRGVDLKHPEFTTTTADEFVIGDLRNPLFTSTVLFAPNQLLEDDKINSFDEVYQLAADMGGAGYIFTGENDANVMHNSALVNLNVAYEAAKKSVKKLFYSSSACIYPKHNQVDPNNPNCEESSAYPAAPDSEYGWEKLFSERLYSSFSRNYKLDCRIARFHNIYGPEGTYDGGKEKAPAALCRKVAQASNQGYIEIWGDGKQTRSFLYIEDCLDKVRKLMDSEYREPVNIGSERMVTINELANIIIKISGKQLKIKHIDGPIGVNGRVSDNVLFEKEVGHHDSKSLEEGLLQTYRWIDKQINF
jgi:nucleoside-diphosphate-sugar epimerase